MKIYPNLIDKTITGICDWILKVTQYRAQDVTDNDTLNQEIQTLTTGVAANTAAISEAVTIPAPGASGNIPISNGSAWVSSAPTGSSPTRQILTSGTAATYTTPAKCKMINVRMIGAGGGAGGAGITTAPSGSQGGTTTFNSVTALGGLGGAGSTASPGTACGLLGGGGGTGGTGGGGLRYPGNIGGNSLNTGNPSTWGGNGASGPWGGGGIGQGGTGNPTGNAGAANSGSGGGGVVHASSTIPSAGGGSGEYVEFQISSPAATYVYTITNGGAGGIGTGTNAQTGGAGGSGVIIVDEYY